MTTDASELFVPGNGHLYVGATSATAPTDATEDITGEFAELGFVTQDGATVTPATTTTKIFSWQSFYATRIITTDRDLTVAIGLQQWNDETVSLYFGGATVTPGTGNEFTITPPDASVLDERSFVLDGIDGDRVLRLYIPRGIVTETAGFVWNRTAEAVLGVTIGLLATGEGEPWEIFGDDAQFPAYP